MRGDEVERIRGYFATPDPAWSRWPRGRHYLVAEKRQLLRRVVDEVIGQAIDSVAICDVGCGDGRELASWETLGVAPARLAGTELAPERAAAAHARLPRADIRLVDGFDLPFADAAFGLTTASLVLSTITDGDARRRLFEEMQRVTTPGGAIAVYDFRVRKPTNRRVVALSRTRVRDLGRPPDHVFGAAPLLPVLDTLLRLPPAIAAPVIALLPRTHAVWVWRRV